VAVAFDLSATAASYAPPLTMCHAIERLRRAIPHFRSEPNGAPPTLSQAVRPRRIGRRGTLLSTHSSAPSRSHRMRRQNAAAHCPQPRRPAPSSLRKSRNPAESCQTLAHPPSLGSAAARRKGSTKSVRRRGAHAGSKGLICHRGGFRVSWSADALWTGYSPCVLLRLDPRRTCFAVRARDAGELPSIFATESGP
jgi:hypothetical protein